MVVTKADTRFAPARKALRIGYVHSASKVIVDKLLVLVMAPLALGVGALVALAIAVFDGAPIFYRQTRIGLNGKPFTCYKFRTMRVDADRILQDLLSQDPDRLREWDEGWKMRRDPRVTRVGQFLRDTSLDELPQLLNVFRGDMSLVGPRPVLREELERYGRYAVIYRSVRPGLTGLWQISGQSRRNYRRRVALDVCYVRKATLATDIRVLLGTFTVVFRREGDS